MACPPKPQRPQIPHDGDIVYYLRIQETDEIKIGTTGHWERRVECLMLQYGTITLIATERGHLEREREVHRVFWRERIDRNREVFRPSAELLDYIASLNDGEDPIVYRALPPWIREVMTTSLPFGVPDNRPYPTDEQLAEWSDLL